MGQSNWLEAVLKKETPEYYEMYEKMKEDVSKKLESIPRLCLWYTDHGIKHCQAILRIMCEMLPEECIYKDIRSESYIAGSMPKRLTIEDVFVLMSCILWHDVGMICGRKEHARLLINFQHDLSYALKDKDLVQTIYNVCCSHSSSSNDVFRSCMNYRSLRFYGGKVNVAEKTLAAMLRIADEISEDRSRIELDPNIFDKVPNDQKIYWEHCASINYSGFDDNTIRLVYNIDKDKIFKEYEIGLDPQNNTLHKTLYRFIIERICKIINEMVYLSPYYTSLFRIDCIDLTISIQEMDNWICVKEIKKVNEKITPFLLEQTDRQIEEFFHQYKRFSPKEIQKEGEL